MHNVHVGDVVHNAVQHAVVRWLGSIEANSVVGLQLTDSTLPGYTDGTCPLDKQRYFRCPDGQGYYVLEATLIDSYKIVPKPMETGNRLLYDDEYNSAEQSFSASPANVSQPIPSSSSPSVSQTQHSSDNDHVISSPRGILSRLTSERDQRKVQVSPSVSTNKIASAHSLSVGVHSASSSHIYRPENYRSASYDKPNEPAMHDFAPADDENDHERYSPHLQITDNDRQAMSTDHVTLFGHEYFLDGWTLGRVKSLLETEISSDQQCCLNVLHDQCDVQQLVDEQITNYSSTRPVAPPTDIRLELFRIYDNVEFVFPSRRIHLYDNDYLLLAILCSHSECAYVRTVAGWAYTDDESDHGQPILVEEISQMIDDLNNSVLYRSEQCVHVLKHASFLYYKLVK